MARSRSQTEFLAKDAYPTWKAFVRRATTGITIFTPYLNDKLLNLIRNASLEPNRITIVTNLYPRDELPRSRQLLSCLQIPSRSQLHTLNKAIERGITCLHLERLHAKVLLIDDRYVVAGSQNFTYQGSINREATVGVREDLQESQFVDTLREWREEAIAITADELTDLIKALSGYWQRLDKIAGEAARAIDAVREHHEQKRAKEREDAEIRERRIERLLRQCRENGRDWILADVKDMGGYPSLVPRSVDFRLWIAEDNRVSSEQPLRALTFYPILVIETNRMALARIARTRLTYIRHDVFMHPGFKIGRFTPNTIGITFPNDDTTEHNVEIELTSSDWNSCWCAILFTDDKPPIVVKSEYYARGSGILLEPDEFSADMKEDFIDRPERIVELMQELTAKGLRFKSLGRDDKGDLGPFLGGQTFRLNVINHFGLPILLATRLDIDRHVTV